MIRACIGHHWGDCVSIASTRDWSSLFPTGVLSLVVGLWSGLSTMGLDWMAMYTRLYIYGNCDATLALCWGLAHNCTMHTKKRKRREIEHSQTDRQRGSQGPNDRPTDHRPRDMIVNWKFAETKNSLKWSIGLSGWGSGQFRICCFIVIIILWLLLWR